MRLEFAIPAVVVALVALFGGDFSVYLATRLCIFAIAAVGLHLITGWTGRVSLGHAAFIGLGAYAHVLVLRADLPLMMALTAAGTLAAGFGGLLALATLRLLGPYFAVATLAFQIIVYQGLVSATELTAGHMGLSVPRVGPQGTTQLLACFLLAVGVAATTQYFLRGSAGRQLLALRDQPQAAEACGVNLVRVRILVFVVSAGLCGLAGGLLSGLSDSIHPDQFSVMTSLEVLIMVVVGGGTTVRGAILGTIVVGVLSATLGQFAELHSALLGAALLLSVYLMPKGLSEPLR